MTEFLPCYLEGIVQNWSKLNFYQNWCETSVVKMEKSRTKTYSGRQFYIENEIGI